jgi:hypothetical protein
MNYKENMDLHQEIQNENNIFLDKYNKAKKKIAMKKDNAFENIFADLLMKYKDKGYHNASELKGKTNLFEVSPLLIENNNIISFFKLGDNYKLYSKDFEYVKNLKGQINERIVNDSRSLSKMKSMKSISMTPSLEVNESGKNSIEDQRSKKEIFREIEKIRKEIDNTNNMINNGEANKIFSENNKIKKESNKELMNKTTNSKLQSKSLASTKSSFYNSRSKLKSENTRKNTSVIQENSNLVNNSSILSKVDEESYPELVRMPLTSIKKKHRKVTSSSMFTLMKQEMKLRSSPNITKRKKKYINEVSFNTLVDIDKKKICDEIEAKINRKRFPEVEKIHEKIINNEANNKEIIDYLVEKVGKDRSILEENLKRKIGPTDVMKYIADLKTKVFMVDFNEHFKNFSQKMGVFDISQNNLNKVA